MATNQLQRRQQAYFNLSSAIAQIDGAGLRALLADSQPFNSWGRNQTVEIGRSKVFVKRVPVTDLEYANLFSTKNLYDLPTFYNYGIGSLGLGVFRELVTHIRTTNWVLQGAIAGFPLLYHYRLVPFAGERAEIDQERHTRYVDYWGQSANIDRYVIDRSNASHELILFLEHIPNTAANWLLSHPEGMQTVIDDTQTAIAFLRSKGILHLDSHFFNLLTDGKQTYLTDFGLVLDKQFDLSPAEQTFHKQHALYDYGTVLWGAGFHLFWMYRESPDDAKQRIAKQCGICEGMELAEILECLIENIDELTATPATAQGAPGVPEPPLLAIDKYHRAAIGKYRAVIEFMDDFFADMRKNSRKDTRFRQTQLRRLLKEAGIVAA